MSLLGLVFVAALSAVAAAGLVISHERAQAALEDRFDTRTAIASAAIGTFTNQLMGSELAAAKANLGTATDHFDVVVATFGFSAAVLLDSRGRVLAVYPSKPALIGKPIAAAYPHLSAAEHGTRAISPVVPAAATGAPVVGFAVPFSTPAGRRVFSGAYQVSATPLQAYLRAMASFRTSRFFLVDARHQALASSSPVSDWHVLPRPGPSRYRDSRPVAGTPWLVVADVSRRELLGPVDGPSQYIPWLILALLFISGVWVWVLLRRRHGDNLRLQEAYTDLDRASRQDGLTGAQTRRSTQELLVQARERTCEAGTALAVLMVDVDHFKRINDTFGHLAGDEALIAVAASTQAQLRRGDILGRWGGEEFLVVLADADAAVAAEVAERIRSAVAARRIALGSGGDVVTLTVSIGCSTSLDASADVLVHTADRAMYAAKGAGRNQVRVHDVSTRRPSAC